MSHRMVVKMGITDLGFLKAAAKRRGLEFKEGQTTFNSGYGQRPCLHALKVEGTDGGIEIGVMRTVDGQGFDLTLDSDALYRGGKLKDACGDGLTKLMDEYGAAVAEDEYVQLGYRVIREVAEDGAIQVIAFQE